MSDGNDILLVEDGSDAVRRFRETFERADLEHRLHVVPDGDAALEFLFRRGEYASAPLPELVLLDLDLPGVSGLEVLGRIRNDSEISGLPVLVLSSSEDPRRIADCYDEHANAFLAKPADPDELVSLWETIDDFWFDRAQRPLL